MATHLAALGAAPLRTGRREAHRLQSRMLSIAFAWACLSWKMIALAPVKRALGKASIFHFLLSQDYFGDELEKWKLRLLGWKAAAM